MTTASELAKYLIRYFCDKEQPISNLKLQKLLYYCQGWHLGIAEAPLFSDAIQAWVHGPVVPVVFQEYRKYRWSPIAPDVKPIPPRLSSASAGIVNAVLDGYGHYSATQLEKLSHSENPWKVTRRGLPDDVPCAREISHESMREYFGPLASA